MRNRCEVLGLLLGALWPARPTVSLAVERERGPDGVSQEHPSMRSFVKPTDDRLRDRLTPEQYRVTQHGGTGDRALGSHVARVSPDNARARRLHDRLGFRAAGTTMLRRSARSGAAL